MNLDDAEALPPYSYVPGGPWPHPRSSPTGHSYGRKEPPARPIEADRWASSEVYLRGVSLFNAGYYWEAHEGWESLWHAHERHGPIADILKALIKLAAAGVKVREGHHHGVVVHARRAQKLFEDVRRADGPSLLGLDLAEWERIAGGLADDPPSPIDRLAFVFAFRIEPR
jgi:uncharacterized protein